MIRPLFAGQTLIHQTAVQLVGAPAWVPSNTSSFGRDIYHYAGQDIVIHESIDSFGAVMWPAVSTPKNITKKKRIAVINLEITNNNNIIKPA